ncbi:LppP/LprE family lipoprotein [Antrihabitans sp. YC2-6]|uniref:LppP/LprE family lipoprotein n=1 Tax=Antrihabitans sp. YC2-6 TaxID=2799498 RepID=UPI0018F5BA96|nr:LppP/LprE family lipoprotein [Antrihabitans sp. YC2-6]MBJ8344124.1 LppP/LprE family lipoprotein [Antrihabitans sp. YC2-6]
MKNVVRALALIAGAAAVVAGCETESGSPSAAETSRAAATSIAAASTTEAPSESETATTTSASATTTADTASNTSGDGLCVDPGSAGVLDAIATLPSTNDWAIEDSSEATIGDCPELGWITVSGGASAAAPIHVLFFHDGTYLGTATSEPYAFTYVSAESADTISVDYKWLAGDEPFCCPAGGPATIPYTWDGSQVVMTVPLPDEVR